MNSVPAFACWQYTSVSFSSLLIGLKFIFISYGLESKMIELSIKIFSDGSKFTFFILDCVF
jgi:hypothetical protein